MLLYSESFLITPVPQERPRARICAPKDGRKPFIIVYDPEKSKTFKKQLQSLARLTAPDVLLDQSMILACRIFIKRPKSVKRDYPEVKPDLSNYIKGVEDALNGIVYTDDSRIVDYDGCRKRYTDDTPRIEIELYNVV